MTKEQKMEMMQRMMQDMKPEEMINMMSQMMPKMASMMAGADPQMMKAMMSKMMPAMMTMGPGSMMENMHEIMPGIMADCLAPLTKEERMKMFGFCRGMLSEMETRFL